MVLFAKVVLSTLALLPFFCFYRKTFRTTLDYPYNEDTNARNVASSASTIREGNTPTRDSIPVHDGTHLKVSILREKNTSTNLWPKTFVWKHAAKPDREGYTTRSQKPMQTMDI